MALRNFWMEAEIDGRKYKICGGPRSRDGEMRIRIYQRNHGESVKSYEILCEPNDDTLSTSVYCNGIFSGQYVSER